jgi:hypothetical protein
MCNIFIEKNLDKVNWGYLSENSSAMQILEKNPDKIDWDCLWGNPSIFELDYDALKKRCEIYKEELIQKALHPSRIKKYLDQGIDFEDLDNYI